MRGACLVICALSLARGAETPLPGEPELNARWLEGFRRDLLRDVYDYETEPRPSPSILGDQIAARRMTGRRSLDTADGPSAGRSTGMPAARHSHDDAAVGHSSGEAGLSLETPDASLEEHSSGKPPRQPLVGNSVGQSGKMGSPPNTPSVGYSLSKPPAIHSIESSLDKQTSDGPAPVPAAQEDPSAESSGRPQARHAPDASGKRGRPLDAPHALDAPSPGRAPARAPDDAASRELGISRRDLYGGRGYGSITDQELDAKRQPFLKHLSELDEQMRPVVMRSDSEARHRHAGRSDIRAKSRKRFWDESEQNQDKSAYIIEPNGVKRYKVHTERRERFLNRDQPWFKEDWSIGEFDEMDGRDEDKYQERESDEDVAHEDAPYQGSRDDSRSQDERDSVSSELGESEYRQGGLRSRYVQDGRADTREYAQRFSARRDAALLADGLSLSSKPCNCTTDNPQIVPEL